MEQETKFKLKAFLLYLVLEPWTSEISMPNLRSLSWGLIFISLLFNNRILTLILISLGLFLYLIFEYKIGKYIHWYRKHERKRTIKKSKDLNMNKTIDNQIITTDTPQNS